MRDETGLPSQYTNTPEQLIDQALHRIRHLHDYIQQLRSVIPTGAVNTLQDTLRQIEGDLKTVRPRVARRISGQENMLALVEIGQIVNSSLELSEVLRIVMDTIIRLTHAERGFLMLRNSAGELEMRVARNWEQESIDPSEFAISRTVVNRVVVEGEPVLTTNAQEDPRFGSQQSVVAYSLRSILCVPLKVKKNSIGVIYTDNRIKSGIFSEIERDLLSAFANQAAVAIDNARLFESLRSTLEEVTSLKDLMDNVFASMASGVITTNATEHITLSNPAAENILDKSRTELIGYQLNEILPEIAQKIKFSLEQIRTTDRKILGLEVDAPLLDNKTKILSLNLAPLKDSNENTQGIAIVLDDLTEKKRLEAQHILFERMVSPSVIEQLDPNKLKLGGRRQVITTLFTDLRGFTHFSEQLEPEKLVSILNMHLAAAAEAILDQAGTIDKFHGDAVLAWFNAPVPQPDHTLRAVRAAIKLRAAIKKLHWGLPEPFRLYFGTGIHSGDAVLGLVGTEKRIEYTAIGDSVNTARRIQEAAAPDQILISASAYEHVAEFISAQPITPVQAKGKSSPIQVLEIIDLR